MSLSLISPIFLILIFSIAPSNSSPDTCLSSLGGSHPASSLFQSDCNTPNYKIDRSLSHDSNIDFHISRGKGSGKHKCFVAAVYEHKRIDIDGDLKGTVEANLERYEKIARLASEHMASILVTPEDGLFYGTRENIRSVLEIVPKLDSRTIINPCQDRKNFSNSPILVRLSCIARKNFLYLVANYGTLEECPDNNRDCQSRQLNTDLVFDAQGNIVTLYYKVNVYVEPFDPPQEPKRVYFDTDFGRFGVITCFDMIFKYPGVDLVEKDHVDSIIFPTWWFDEQPILTAVQVQQAWSYTMNVNLLAANIHNLSIASAGSGIYSAHKGPLINSGPKERGSTLMLATLAAHPTGGAEDECVKHTAPKLIEVDKSTDIIEYKFKSMDLSHETDLIRTLDKPESTIIECKKELCCMVSYKINNTDSESLSAIENGNIVMIMRNSLRNGRFVWWEQLCVIATLKNKEKLSFSDESIVRFESIKIEAKFSSHYVYPIFAHNVSSMINISHVKIDCNKLENVSNYSDNSVAYKCSLETCSTPSSRPISVIGFYGRVYERDHSPQPKN